MRPINLFRLTEKSLGECEIELEDLLAGSTKRLTADELEAAKNIVRICATILDTIADAEDIKINSRNGVRNTVEAIDEILRSANANCDL